MANWQDAYSGEISFMRAGFASGPSGVDIAVLGVPYDLGTTGRPGARYGPRAVREQSLAVGEFEWGVWPWSYDVKARHKVRDLGDIQGFTAYPERLCPALEKTADEILEAGASLLAIGGDHFISLPLLRAHARRHGPLALIHFDAHSDTWVDPDLNHGTMFYHALQEGLIAAEHSIQVGLRTPNPNTHGIQILPAEELLEMQPGEVCQAIRQRVGEKPAYLTLDIDFLDPAYAPATGTPVCGGPNTALARRILQGLAGLRIVGGDQVEVAPHYDSAGQITALAGATLAADILYLIGEGRSAG